MRIIDLSRAGALGLFLVAGLVGCDERVQPGTGGTGGGGAGTGGAGTGGAGTGGAGTGGAGAPMRDGPTADARAAELASFNAGLLRGFVRHAEYRTPIVSQSIAMLSADVLCMQEVWAKRDADIITAMAAATYPHHQRFDTTYDGGFVTPDASLPGRDGGAGSGGAGAGGAGGAGGMSGSGGSGGAGGSGSAIACTMAELDPLLTCINANCMGRPNDQLVQCGQQFCSNEIFNLNEMCLNCIAANLSMTIQGIVNTCTMPGGGNRFAQDGSNGLLLLSRFPILEEDHLVFPSFLNRRVAVSALVDLPSLGKTRVLCTHLTASFSSSVPYSGPYASWDDENAQQIELMIRWGESKVRAGERLVIMGDMNQGPAIPTAMPPVEGEVMANYPIWAQHGYKDLYIEGMSNPLCTFCRGENPYVSPMDNRSIIDHVFMKDATQFKSARILDQPIQVTVPDAGIEEGRLSDHYGIRVDVSK